MFIINIKYRSSLKPLISLAFLLFCYIAYPQNRSDTDTLKISAVTYIHFRESISLFETDPQNMLPSGLISAKMLLKDKNLIFFDSLKVKASKNRFTKKLYDVIIISHKQTDKSTISSTSDASYLSHSGKKIRNIEVQRLNVFGADINNPASRSPNKTENILNKSHVNTNERIIRNNLLFSKGDTISPLALSDNERILRQLPFIDDARIIVVPVSEDEADIVVLTKDVYSLGGAYSYKGLKKGTFSLFEKNILGIGHELGIDMPYDSHVSDSPGFGVHYTIDNIKKSFVTLNFYYLNGLVDRTYGFSLNRKFISSTTKYAGGISVQRMYTKVNLDTLPVPEPLKYNLQDYWIARSFLINRESVYRIIIGGRYTNNNVFDRPFILPDSYYELTNYRMFLGAVTFSAQKYYKTNLIYSYGRTEDIPYGGLVRLTLGREYNEFNSYKRRTYLGTEIALGKSSKSLGYYYASAGIGAFLNGNQSKQGVLSLDMKYFSNLVKMGNNMIRNFININYTKGYDRNTNEFLIFDKEKSSSGFRNDSVKGTQRLSLSIESVIFSPANIYGFRFAFFGFADFSFLSQSNEAIGKGYSLSEIGLGIRIRNDNLLFNTLQFRFGFFPNPPIYSNINHVTISGEQLLRPNNFDTGPPSVIPYR
jgi:hypothetical protein